MLIFNQVVMAVLDCPDLLLHARHLCRVDQHLFEITTNMNAKEAKLLTLPMIDGCADYVKVMFISFCHLSVHCFFMK